MPKIKQAINLISVSILCFMSLLALLALSRAYLTDFEQLTAFISLRESSSSDLIQVEIESASKQFSITEEIDDPSFEEDSGAWIRKGVANLVSEFNNIVPSSGQKMMQIGLEANSGEVAENCIRQHIEQIEAKTLSFNYQLLSTETLDGFDQPALVVFINSLPVFQDGFNPADNSLEENNWNLGLIDLSRFHQQDIEVSFCAGNTGDSFLSPLVLLDDVSTNNLLLAQTDLLLLSPKSEDYSLAASYSLANSDELYLSDLGEGLALSFQEQLLNSSLNLKVYDAQENLKQEQNFVVLTAFNSPEAVTDLQVFEEFEHEYSFTFSVPEAADTNLSHYQLAVSNQVINPENWADAQRLEIIANLGPDFYPCPSLSGITQTLVATINLENSSLDLSASLYFGLKTVDVAGNKSELSNIVELETDGSLNSGSIKINEIMFNPIGSDRGEWLNAEWVELINTSDVQIDVSQWQLVDEVGNSWEVSTENSDTNLDFYDSGETALEPGAMLITYKQGGPILNNSGDTLKLLDSSGDLVDEVTYPGSSSEGSCYGRMPDGVSNWVMNLLPSPLEPNLINSN